MEIAVSLQAAEKALRETDIELRRLRAHRGNCIALHGAKPDKLGY